MAKITKKIEKDLVESKNNVNFAPEMSKMTFKTEFNFRPVFEKMSPDPVKSLIPNEALSIREILVRSSRGQRLNVHTRFRAEGIPDNMYYPEDAVKNSESIHDTPPDYMNDVVDLFAYKDDIDRRKAELEKNAKKKHSERSDNGHPDGKDNQQKKVPDGDSKDNA